ncbi:MAG: hypothetical protein RLZ12_1048 [Bacillota bacterium]|jgi:biotin--protein ligase
MQKIYIYKDTGVCLKSYQALSNLCQNFINDDCTVQSIDAIRIIKGDWVAAASTIIFPGGADLPYAKKLNGAGNNNIKAFVTEGGAYLGICAGAYYGSSFCDFASSVHCDPRITVLGNRELAFYPGHTIGPFLAPYTYNKECGARTTKIMQAVGQEKYYNAYFNGGCYFAEPEKFSNVTVLARYAAAGFMAEAAVVLCRVGTGCAVLSGVHPELKCSPDDQSLLLQNILQYVYTYFL